jgi:hypothetical protein
MLGQETFQKLSFKNKVKQHFEKWKQLYLHLLKLVGVLLLFAGFVASLIVAGAYFPEISLITMVVGFGVYELIPKKQNPTGDVNNQFLEKLKAHFVCYKQHYLAALAALLITAAVVAASFFLPYVAASVAIISMLHSGLKFGNFIRSKVSTHQTKPWAKYTGFAIMTSLLLAAACVCIFVPPVASVMLPLASQAIALVAAAIAKGGSFYVLLISSLAFIGVGTLFSGLSNGLSYVLEKVFNLGTSAESSYREHAEIFQVERPKSLVYKTVETNNTLKGLTFFVEAKDEQQNEVDTAAKRLSGWYQKTC